MLERNQKLSKSFVSDTREPTTEPSHETEVPTGAWSAHMWYRFATYQEASSFVSIYIDVMVDGSDIALLPTPEVWERTAPSFVKTRREEVIERLMAIKWNRELSWDQSDRAVCWAQDPSSGVLLPGGIESTQAGRFLEERGLFNPGSPVSFAQARMLWSGAESRFAASATGPVTLFVSHARPNSMFNRIALPILRRNPNVTLNFRDDHGK